MDLIDRSQLRQQLLKNSDFIADAWYQAIADTSFVSLSASEIRQRLMKFTVEILEVLLAKNFTPNRVRSIGEAFADIYYLYPEVLGKTQTFFAEAIAEILHKEQLDIIYPRLVLLFAEIAQGFSTQMLDAILLEQDKLRIRQLKKAPESTRGGEDYQGDSQTQQYAADLALYHNLNRAANTGASLSKLVSILIDNLGQCFDYSGSGVYLISEDGQYLEMHGQVFSPKFIEKLEKFVKVKIPTLRLPLTEGSFYKQHLNSGEIMVRDDPEFIQQMIADFIESTPFPTGIKTRLRPLAPAIQKLMGVKAALAAPLVADDRPIGILSISRREAFSANEAARMSAFADQVTAIFNSKLADMALKDHLERLEEIVGERTQELRDAQAQLIQSEKMAILGQLAGGVAHELRHPLGVIRNAIYYLETVIPITDQSTVEYFQIIDSESHSAAKIVSDLLDYAFTPPSHPESIDVDGLIDMVLDDYPTIEGIMIRKEIAAGTPPLFVDKHHIIQVLTNLIANAHQAMPEGGQLLVLGRVDGSVINRQSIDAGAPKPVIAIDVIDTGKGISPENMKKLFEPLFTTKPRGIGLGLAISKNLAEANGGSITVKSVEGEGSTFSLLLPAFRAKTLVDRKRG